MSIFSSLLSMLCFDPTPASFWAHLWHFRKPGVTSRLQKGIYLVGFVFYQLVLHIEVLMMLQHSNVNIFFNITDFLFLTPCVVAQKAQLPKRPGWNHQNTPQPIFFVCFCIHDTKMHLLMEREIKFKKNQFLTYPPIHEIPSFL